MKRKQPAKRKSTDDGEETKSTKVPKTVQTTLLAEETKVSSTGSGVFTRPEIRIVS